MTWMIKHEYGFEPVEVVKTTSTRIYYKRKTWSGDIVESYSPLHKILTWHGDEEMAHQLSKQLNNARDEFDRRRNAAREWYDARIKEIINVT